MRLYLSALIKVSGTGYKAYLSHTATCKVSISDTDFNFASCYFFTFSICTPFMSMYPKFQIGEADRFDPERFPQLETSLQKIVALLNREPAGPKADMLLSFVKTHSISSQSVVDHPALATLISTKGLPLGVMEDLFESSRNNPSFKSDLEAHIRASLVAAKLY